MLPTELCCVTGPICIVLLQTSVFCYTCRCLHTFVILLTGRCVVEQICCQCYVIDDCGVLFYRDWCVASSENGVLCYRQYHVMLHAVMCCVTDSGV